MLLARHERGRDLVATLILGGMLTDSDHIPLGFTVPLVIILELIMLEEDGSVDFGIMSISGES